MSKLFYGKFLHKITRASDLKNKQKYIGMYIFSTKRFLFNFFCKALSRLGEPIKRRRKSTSANFNIGLCNNTAGSTALTRERECVSQSQFAFPSCLEWPLAVLADSSNLERQIWTEMSSLSLVMLDVN